MSQSQKDLAYALLLYNKMSLSMMFLGGTTSVGASYCWGASFNDWSICICCPSNYETIWFTHEVLCYDTLKLITIHFSPFVSSWIVISTVTSGFYFVKSSIWITISISTVSCSSFLSSSVSIICNSSRSTPSSSVSWYIN